MADACLKKELALKFRIRYTSLYTTFLSPVQKVFWNYYVKCPDLIDSMDRLLQYILHGLPGKADLKLVIMLAQPQLLLILCYIISRCVLCNLLWSCRFALLFLAELRLVPDNIDGR